MQHATDADVSRMRSQLFFEGDDLIPSRTVELSSGG